MHLSSRLDRATRSLCRVGLVSFLGLALAACGDDAADGSGASGAGAAGNGGAGAVGNGGNATGGAGAEGGAAGCAEPALNPGDVCVSQVSGTLVDEAGQPIGDMLTTVCGTISCDPGFSEGDGQFSVDVDAFIPLGDFSTNPHGREAHKAVFYFALPTDVDGPVIDMGELLLLDMPTDGPTLIAKQDDMGAPQQSLTSNGVTLDVPEGVQIELDFEDVLEDNRQFEARSVPENLIERFAPGEDLAALWAFYPFEAAFRPEGEATTFTTAQLSMPNDIGLDPDTPVEFLAHGSFLYAGYVKPASFEVVAVGAVSSDGTRIEMAPGEGVEILTWVGVRPQ